MTIWDWLLLLVVAIAFMIPTDGELKRRVTELERKLSSARSDISELQGKLRYHMQSNIH